MGSIGTAHRFTRRHTRATSCIRSSPRFPPSGGASLNYTIRHVTKFTYEVPISESIMEARMQPRTESAQRCIRFGLSTTPASHVRMYQDHAGNTVHHFSIPGPHSQLTVTAEGLVECAAPSDTPARLERGAWGRL